MCVPPVRWIADAFPRTPPPRPLTDPLLLHLQKLREPNKSVWFEGFEQATHGRERIELVDTDLIERFDALCAARAWLEAAMLLLPGDRAIRMHRYLGKKSGWAQLSVPNDESYVDRQLTNPTRIFMSAPCLEAAVLMCAIQFAQMNAARAEHH